MEDCKVILTPQLASRMLDIWERGGPWCDETLLHSALFPVAAAAQKETT